MDPLPHDHPPEEPPADDPRAEGLDGAGPASADETIDEDILLDFPRAASTQAKPTSRRSRAILSLLLSIAIHAPILLAAKLMLNRPASVSVQSGGASGEGMDVPGDGLPPMRADPLASLPQSAGPIAPPPADLSPPADPLAQVVDPIASHKETAELISTADSSVIGLSPSIEADPAPQFTHRLPASLRPSTAAGAPEATGPASDRPMMAASIGPHSEGPSDHPGTGGGSSGAVGAMPVGSSRNKAPVYPREAKRLRLEGTVVLLVEVLEDGTVGQISISQSSAYDMLDQAALEAVRQWRFTPALVDGHPARTEGSVPIEFSLRG